MKQPQIIIVINLMLFLIWGCDKENQSVHQMEIDFQWNPPCTSTLIIPEITVGNIPSGTKRFYVALTDLDLPAFSHGGGFVKYDGTSVILPGTVDGFYRGPSPPQNVIHDYEIKVEARDEDNQTIGLGKKVHRYPPKGEEEARWGLCNEK